MHRVLLLLLIIITSIETIHPKKLASTLIARRPTRYQEVPIKNIE